MKTEHKSIQVEHNSNIREYKIYYYRTGVDGIDDSKILRSTINIESAILDMGNKEFTSIINFKKYLNEDVRNRDKINAYNERDIRNALDVFNSSTMYDGVEIILPYYIEPYENSAIQKVYDIFVEKLHIELDNE